MPLSPNGKGTDSTALQAIAVYESRLKSRHEPTENGKFVVINLDTGEYELDVDDLTASRRAAARFNGARTVMLKVGDIAAYRIGCGARREVA